MMYSTRQSRPASIMSAGSQSPIKPYRIKQTMVAVQVKALSTEIGQRGWLGYVPHLTTSQEGKRVGRLTRRIHHSTCRSASDCVVRNWRRGPQQKQLMRTFDHARLTNRPRGPQESGPSLRGPGRKKVTQQDLKALPKRRMAQKDQNLQ